MNKICTKCREEKPLSKFSKHISMKDGYGTMCKACYNFHNNRYERSLNMREVFKYDNKYNLLSMYENVLEAVQEENGISSTDIYKACLGRLKTLQGGVWSFEQRLPQHLINKINKWIENSELQKY